MSLSRLAHSRFLILAALCASILLAHGCATPVGVRHLDPKAVQQTLTANVLSGETLSAPTLQILNRAGLKEKFQSDPEDVLTLLHRGLPTATESDRLFALAELSFAHASKKDLREYFLASALYAYAFLFPGDGPAAVDMTDPRIRVALDLYNRGIAEGFTVEGNRRVVIEGGTYKLPFGAITIATNPEDFNYGIYRLVNLVQAAELDVRGLRNRYRWPGIGAPLAASLQAESTKEMPVFKVPPGIKVAVTAFLRPDNSEEILKSGQLRGRVELYTAGEATSVSINGRTVPLEYELSSALAYTLEGSQAYKFDLKGLFSGDFSIVKDKARFEDGVFFMEPYQPGRIPVVLVHGTASSPAWWAEMINELQNDRNLWGHYQLWLFTYNTGNPILYSGGLLADGLKNLVTELDPEGKDPALRKMVVIGHSQGGLLTKLTTIHTGTCFWDKNLSKPIDELSVSAQTKTILKRSLCYEPVPAVRRVVFVATPHRGSFVAGGWIGRLTGKLISLPFRILSPLQEVMAADPSAVSLRSLKDIPRSTDNMDPKSPFIKMLEPIPIAEGITAHSIVAVRNPEAPREKWTDGVVNYSSAHIDGVESELIVHSSHSTQAEPATIEEVRRILIEHLKAEGN
jgi:pimeloyl-ACP methyl ester carboxylesterase